MIRWRGGELDRQGGVGEHSVLFNDLIRVKNRSILRVSRLLFPYLHSVRPHLGVEVAGSRRPVLCPVLSMRVPAYEYGVGYISGTSKLSTGRHFSSASCLHALLLHATVVDPVPVKAHHRDKKGVVGRFYFTAALSRVTLLQATNPGLQEGFHRVATRNNASS